MRLDSIYPADDPQVAVFSGHGLRLRLETGASEPPGTIRILTDDPGTFAGGARELTAPNGTRVEVCDLNPPMVMPRTVHAFVVKRLADSAPWVIGRAGMHYRDLIPDRLGGSIIASHIRIPDGGPVPDMVHFHRVGFQLIFCVAGWVDVVYEDQGERLRLTAGDCFIQPPEIRHRVLEASEGIEVIEIGVPAEHVTEIDHDMTLPTPDLRPDREWQGQRFVHNLGAAGRFHPFRIPGFEARDTTIAANTQGVASVMVARPAGGACGRGAGWRRRRAGALDPAPGRHPLHLRHGGRACGWRARGTAASSRTRSRRATRSWCRRASPRATPTPRPTCNSWRWRCPGGSRPRSPEAAVGSRLRPVEVARGRCSDCRDRRRPLAGTAPSGRQKPATRHAAGRAP